MEREGTRAQLDMNVAMYVRVVLPRFGTFSPYEAIFNSKGPNRGSTTIALREMQMFTFMQILKIARNLYHPFINSAQIKYSRCSSICR